MQLRDIGVRCREFAIDHNGRFPTQWLELDWNQTNRFTTSNWPQMWVCPTLGHKAGAWDRVDLWSDYRLIAGRTTNDAPDTILAIEPLANHNDGAHVLFVDGSTAWWPASKLANDKN